LAIAHSNLPRQLTGAKTTCSPQPGTVAGSPVGRCAGDPLGRGDSPDFQQTTMDKKYSKYQQRIIKNYYENRDAISLQRLSELVTELYLSEGKARERQWKFIVAALEKLGLPAERIEHLRKKDDPRLLAKLVEELMAKQK
jgi:hypothetical protein